MNMFKRLQGKNNNLNKESYDIILSNFELEIASCQMELSNIWLFCKLDKFNQQIY